LLKSSLFSRFINRVWVNSHQVPFNPVKELKVDHKRPVIYVVEQNNASDLLGLQACCKKVGLPDPYQPLLINGEEINALIFIHHWSVFSSQAPQLQDAPYLTQYEQLLALHQHDPSVDIQLVPVTFYWGRNPGREGKKSWLNDHPRLPQQGQANLLKQSLMVMKHGRDHLVRFNPPISIKQLNDRGKSTGPLAHKLAKVAMRYFESQKRTSIGPQLPNRQQMIETVLAQPYLREVIRETASTATKSEAEVEAQCRRYLNEISANFSYRFLRVFRLFLKGIWNIIYQGIEVHHSQAVRDVCQSGAEVIYMPCHRSHMDYLLLSYLLFEQGVVPPHVAAGVNLNFFPAGPIFRRSGAFFLRRTFKDNPLYANVFNAYFAMLFKQGYPIEFFTEGGRSRTGLLLSPKTGLLSTSLKTYLRQPERNVVIVPIYIGYDHIMEVNTYVKEQAGQQKERESIWQVLGIVKKLGNFGRAFVNFGEPINVKQHFDQTLPHWQTQSVSEAQFKEQVALIARKVMVNINAATAVNALPLCALVLLANKSSQVEQSIFLEQLSWHQQWLALNDENSLVTYEQGTSEALLQQALAQKKFQLAQQQVQCTEQQAQVLHYYRNNIVHLFVVPSLIFHAMHYLSAQKQPVQISSMLELCASPYAALQAKYFLNEDVAVKEVLLSTMNKLVALQGLVAESGQYRIVDNALAQLLMGHLADPFDKTGIEI